MKKISFVTTNPHKYEEMKRFFNTQSLELKWLKKKTPEIQGDSLEDVVKFALSNSEEKDIIVEDAGFFVQALKGFPGVFSRYVFETIGNHGILRLLEGAENRSARFVSVIGYLGGGVKLFKGEVQGFVSNSIKGSYGFGYDPLFVPHGYQKTFGEDPVLKSRVSHRKRAAYKLIKYLKRV